MTDLRGELIRLRPAGPGDVARLAAIRATPEVRARWPGDDLEGLVLKALQDEGLHVLAIVAPGDRVVGAIQYAEEADPDYRHASLDIYLDPAVHGRGYCTDAVRVLARHLIERRGHHRLTIDPAADNAAAIRCYEKAGFRPVGIMRDYERGADGTWHDGLLMDLVRSDIRS